MEKSIKRVEKLVHSTNSALAQMKFSLMFDDMNGGDGKEKFQTKGFDPGFREKFLDGDDLRLCQDEFKSEANEMLARMESMYPSSDLLRKNSKAVDRIKEINRKMNSLRLEQSKQEETEQSRQKLWNLINEEKLSSGVTSSWESAQSKQGHANREKEKKHPEKVAHSGLKKTDSVLTITKSPNKPKEELKSKILETQDIVNRGFQTARQLAQKVETISKGERKDKTPSSEKTGSDLRSWEGKAESNETLSTVKCRRCTKRRRRRREDDEVEESNIRIIEIKRKELERCRRSNLQLQRLPSVHIRGGLQMQRVHNLEIPAGGDSLQVKSNTAISFLSHEQMEREKMGEIIEKARKEHCCCTGSPHGNYVECFNCGKLIRIRETCVDPRKVDEILQRCNFDVFDPRIDEFVEKCGTGASISCSKKTQTSDVPETAIVVVPEVTPKETTRKKVEEDNPKKKCPKLKLLSDQLFKKYKQETEMMESNHEKLDNILQSLFRQVDESREVFEKCHLFRNKTSDGRTAPNLTATKPVLVSLETGTSIAVKKKYRKSEKQIVSGRHKSRSVSTRSQTDVQKGEGLKWTEKEEMRRRAVIYADPSENVKSEERKEEISGRVAVFSNSQSSLEILSDDQRKTEESSLSLSTSKSSSSNRSKCASGKENVEETPYMSYRRPKTSDRISRREETQRETVQPNEALKPAEIRKEAEEEKAASETDVSSSSRRTRQSDEGGEKTTLIQTRFETVETEKKKVAAVPSKSEGKELSETSSDNSENNYESDFESPTNEQNEECEAEEQEVKEGVSKLSTISEVDSELEKRVSDEQRTTRSSQKMDDSPKSEPRKREKDVDSLKQKDGNSSESRKTEAVSPKTAEASIKSTPTELVTSLKDILTALQDQFVRTESLADKLTENVKWEATEKGESGGMALLGSWRKPIGAEFVENLRSARKDLRGGPKTPRRPGKGAGRREKSPEDKGFPEGSVTEGSDEGGSSLGEIIVSSRRRKTSERSEASSVSECSFLRLDSVRKSARAASARRESKSSSGFKLEVNSEEVLYSEGEIPSDDLFAFERFRTSSVGEVISEKNSAASTTAE